MSLKPPYLILIITLNLITACSGNSNLQNAFQPAKELQEKNQPTENLPVVQTKTDVIKLPDNFPTEIPTYPNAKIVATEPGDRQGENQIFWTSTEPINTIFDFYKQKLTSWEIKEVDNKLLATKDNLSLELSLVNENAETKYLLKYSINDIANQLPEKPSTPQDITSQPTNQGGEKPVSQVTNLDKVPETLAKYVSEVKSLGVIENSELNQTITRREFARWLLKTNNILYQDDPGKQVRLASETSQPVFTDVPKTDPDFAVIQGLAEAGIIPSSLTNDLSIVTFNPNNNLTREDLILWKVPLDSRQALPNASLDSIKQTWGFQDVAKINPKTLQALLVDFQNGEQSNVKRVFGFTTLFQPKKTVTRAEAAASLWYFGYQGDGKNATANQQAQ